jgi:hypothetical protein
MEGTDRMNFDRMSTDPELLRLLAESRKQVEAMTPAEREAMFTAQAKSFVRAETNWPKANYEWVNGVKVYASYEDYCND